MYEADRAQHVHFKIKPLLEKNIWVLCDRFTASSIAFQSGGREISEEQTKWLNKFATDDLKPDVTILLDISYEDSQKRIGNANREEKDRIESEDEAFHKRVRASYLEQAKGHADWVVLDANLSEKDLLAQLIEALSGLRVLP